MTCRLDHLSAVSPRAVPLFLPEVSLTLGSLRSLMSIPLLFPGSPNLSSGPVGGSSVGLGIVTSLLNACDDLSVQEQ